PVERSREDLGGRQTIGCGPVVCSRHIASEYGILIAHLVVYAADALLFVGVRYLAEGDTSTGVGRNRQLGSDQQGGRIVGCGIDFITGDLTLKRGRYVLRAGAKISGKHRGGRNKGDDTGWILAGNGVLITCEEK